MTIRVFLILLVIELCCAASTGLYAQQDSIYAELSRIQLLQDSLYKRLQALEDQKAINALSESNKPQALLPEFTGDFRFRFELDWDSRRPDGSFRDDRSRLRYRFRFGFILPYQEWASLGMRLRTGVPSNQQDPQLTIGSSTEEYEILPLGFEKIFFKVKSEWLSFWLGKNTFPFQKQNELFWSDNVYPEGVAVTFDWATRPTLFSKAHLTAGHFIVTASGKGMELDQYFQGLQAHLTLWDDRLELFPSFYYFHQMPDLPDGLGTYSLDYSIFHVGGNATLMDNINLKLTWDFYQNLQDYSQNQYISTSERDQKTGAVIALELGRLQEKNQAMLGIYYMYLERYSAVDFMAQNDWARWSYSEQGSSAGRLTNINGLELRAAYLIDARLKLSARFFQVGQLVKYGAARELNSRIRFDLDIGF